MRLQAFSILLIIVLPIAALGQAQQRVYRWVDEEGVVHFGDSIPAQYAELPKQVLNERGVTVDHLQGKKTPEEIEAERLARELEAEQELQRRADQALLATYLTVDEILMHRDRRVELFQAQSRVTELYLRNLQRRLDSLERDAAAFKPYSSDPEAPLIDPDLAEDLRTTRETIARHQNNLQKFRTDEQQIIARFDGDIDRFKVLKGID